MQLKKLLSDDRAVSPVIGVILMVAITVILAAVIGTFVLGLGDQLSSSSPSASIGFDYDETTDDGGVTTGNLTVSHNGGDKIEASNVNVTANTDIGYWNGDDSTSFVSSTNSSISFADMTVSGEVGAGDSVKIAGAANSVPTGGAYTDSNDKLASSTVRVVWSTPNSDSTAQLGKWDGPDA